MTGFLVLSRHHGLTPLANRLAKESHPVEVLAWSDRYDRAWAGRLEPVLSGEQKKRPRSEQITHLQKLLEWGEVALVTDSTRWAERFPGGKIRLTTVESEPPPPVRLGAWFDGEKLMAPHLLVEDRGAWPGGMGAQVPGGMSLVRLPVDGAWFLEALHKATEEAKSASHRGLVQIVGDLTAATGLAYERVVLGWHGLHTHAFLAALGEDQLVGALLLGEREPELVRRFATVAPVTIPPWPVFHGARPVHEGAPVRFVWPGASESEAKRLSEAALGQVAWHDIRVDAEAREVFVAGLDGLVGVVRGVGDSLYLARSRALELAAAMDVPEKQYRPDVGEAVEGLLARLEAAGLAL